MQKHGQKAPIRRGGSNQKNKHAAMAGGIRVGAPKPSFPPR